MVHTDRFFFLCNMPVYHFFSYLFTTVSLLGLFPSQMVPLLPVMVRED